MEGIGLEEGWRRRMPVCLTECRACASLFLPALQFADFLCIYTVRALRFVRITDSSTEHWLYLQPLASRLVPDLPSFAHACPSPAVLELVCPLYEYQSWQEDGHRAPDDWSETFDWAKERMDLRGLGLRLIVVNTRTSISAKTSSGCRQERHEL
ncbi:hypothetical protein VTI74DRAFT_3043 [Chaetomium olivicolor]